MNRSKGSDWFKVRPSGTFSRLEAVALAYVCKSLLEEKAFLPKSYISQDEYELALAGQSHSVFSVLSKYTWQKTIKDKLKNMLQKLRKHGVHEDFYEFTNYMETFIIKHYES